MSDGLFEMTGNTRTYKHPQIKAETVRITIRRTVEGKKVSTGINVTIEILQVANPGVSHRESQRLDSDALKDAFQMLIDRQADLDSPITLI